MNKKINQLSVRTAVGTDLALVGDPTTGTSYKTTINSLPLVPYTGATGPVNLGAYDLTVNSITVGRGLGANINNTVVGSQAGAAFTTAQTNVAIGEQALKVHSTGNANTAVGRYAMLSDVDGEFNTALGTSALVFLASGVNTGNTAIGVNGLGRLTSGSYNTWLGYTSAPGGILTSGSFNTIIGGQVNVGVATLNNNIILADGQGNIRFRDDATSTILSRLAGTGTRMVISDANGALSTQAITSGTVTSVGLSMPNAFGVANSPITSNGTLAVTALGSASQYIRGDGELATLPTGGSGGSSVSYYLNGGTAASVGTYFQMSTTAVIGTNADFTRTGNGLVSQFLTDVGDPNRLQIPAGNWNFEMFFSMSSSGGTTGFYVELLKYDGTTFTSIASSSAIPETISSGTAIDLYLTSLAIPATTLLTTDRLALRVYIVNNSGGRTATLHTQDSHLCQIITNFAGGVSALNGLTANTQYFATGTSGTNFAIVSSGDTHTFNLPTASATNRGALSSADWTTFNSKQEALTLTTTGTSGAATLVGATLNIPQYAASMAIGGAITSATAGSVLFAGTSGVLAQNNANLFWDNTNVRLGIGTASPAYPLDINGTSRFTDNLLVSKNQNASTSINITNTTSGTSSQSGLTINSNGNGTASFFKYSTTTTPYKILNSGDAFLYNSFTGDISILNDTGNGKIKFANGTSTPQMTLTNAGRLLIGTTTEGVRLLEVNGNAKIGNNIFDDSFSPLVVGVNGATARISVANDSNYQDALFVNTSITSGNINCWGFGQRRDTYFGNTIGSFQIVGSYINNSGVGSGSLYVPLILNPNGDVLIASATANAVNGNVIIANGTGKVAIGTNSISSFKLDVNGTARVSGDFTIADAKNIILAATTGTKIGTATSQKLSFWNATPIVQPTTGIAEAAFVENLGGSIVNVDSTFAGYTLQQIAQALKDMGALA